MMDIYQERYLEHRERKKRVLAGRGETEDTILALGLFGAVEARVSQRIFNDEKISLDDMAKIYEAIRLAPSSCNRQAILVRPAILKVDREDLETLLVGGRDWLASAKVILLLFADMAAYKSPAEVEFMPYLDAGVVVGNVYLAATALGIGACYVNPNIRSSDRVLFSQRFNPRGLRFCGAMALGKYDAKAARTPKRQTERIFL